MVVDGTSILTDRFVLLKGTAIFESLGLLPSLDFRLTDLLTNCTLLLFNFNGFFCSVFLIGDTWVDLIILECFLDRKSR